MVDQAKDHLQLSSLATLCFGIQLNPELILPWDDDFEMWWLETICGYIAPFKIRYYRGGDAIKPDGSIEDPLETMDRLQHKHDFLIKHPCPVTLVQHSDADQFILALKVFRTDEDPVLVDLEELDSTILSSFCDKYGVPTIGESNWWLCMLWY